MKRTSRFLRNIPCVLLAVAGLLWGPSATRAGVIVNVVETGGDGTVTAKWTGNSFTGTASFPAGTYTVPPYGVLARCFVDRAHAHTNASGTVLIPSYLTGNDYILTRNDNRDNAGFRLDVTVSTDVIVYMLVDNRIGDTTANAANPPFNGTAITTWSGMTWMGTAGFRPVTTAQNRTANSAVPDEVGIDESADGTINNWYSVYTNRYAAGTFSLNQQGLAGNNMYAVVIAPAPITLPPATPTNVVSISADSKVTLSWSVSAGASAYVVKRGATPGGPYTLLVTNATTSYMDTTVVNGQTYYYVVSAYNSAGESANSLEVIGQPNIAPQNVVATGGTNQIRLTWDALAGATDYTVRRSAVSGGPYTVVASGIAATTYTDTGLVGGQRYYYLIGGTLTGGFPAGNSAEVTAFTAPSNLTDSLGELFAATIARIRYGTLDQVVPTVNIEKSSDGVSFSPLASLSTARGTNFDSGLLPSTTNYYRLQAMNGSGFSAYTPTFVVVTPSGGFNINFANGTNSSANPALSPVPNGYLQDYGELFADQGAGVLYGWSTVGGTNITRDSRWRQSASSPDIRFDTFNHLQKASPATWEIQIPNGFYKVRIVGGDPTAVDSTFQYNVEGVITPTYVPVAGAWWADFTLLVPVSDGRLTVAVGPSAANSKINFIDIYPEIPTLPTFVTQPQNVTAEEYHQATLTATLSGGTAPFTYLWYRDGNPTPVSTVQPTLSFPNVRAADAGNYQLVITNYAGSLTSMTASVTVFADTNPPTILSVYSLDGWTIGVCFSEEMDDSAMAVTDNFTYTINGGAAGAVVPVLLRPDKKSVILKLDQQINGLFTLALGVTVNDLAGNPASMNPLTNTVAGFFASDVGAPARAGLHYTCDGQNIEVVGGGADIWGTADQGYLINKSVNGDFDAKVRVTDLRGSNAITKAALMVRESTNADARVLHVTVNPAPPGRDQFEAGYRAATTGATASWGGTFVPAGVPNAWMRLMRFGNEFRGYRSANGVDWVLLASTNQVYPADAIVGIGLTAHDNTLLATGTFSGLTISAAVGPASVNPAYNGSTFTAGVPTESGIAYDVKYKNSLTDPVWTFLATINGDGTVKTYTDPGPVSPTNARFYRVFFH